MVTPNEAIIKAYEDLPNIIEPKEWPEDECPICLVREGSCYCNATSMPPCGWCEDFCEHTNEEKNDYEKVEE